MVIDSFALVAILLHDLSKNRYRNIRVAASHRAPAPIADQPINPQEVRVGREHEISIE